MPYSPGEEHLAKLDVGRRQARAVRRYLTSLAGRPKRPRGRPRDWDAAIGKAEKTIASASDPLVRLEAVQRRQDLQAQRADDVGHWQAQGAEEALAGFVEHAAAYSEAHGISYRAWRMVGVPAAGLKAAGIPIRRIDELRQELHD